MMETQVFDLRTQYEAGMAAASRELQRGGLVIFPTETVYGIGADAENADAVAKIYKVKGRPSNNPLIAHIWDFAQVERIARDISPLAWKLMRAFWPGPFTIVLPSSGLLPPVVSGGLQTIAVRMPESEYARGLLRQSGKIVVAPSANLSGKPSTTTAAQCLDDFAGKVPVILDGGPCRVGLESTVCQVTAGVPVILRPGGVTAEMIRAEAGAVEVSHAVLHGVAPGENAPSPGMMYKHYAPKAKVCIVQGGGMAIANAVKSMYDKEEEFCRTPCIFCTEERAGLYGGRRVRSLGKTPEEVASSLFGALREADKEGIDAIYFEGMEHTGIGLAIANRMIRAAGFDVVDAGKEEEVEKHIAGMHRKYMPKPDGGSDAG